MPTINRSACKKVSLFSKKGDKIFYGWIVVAVSVVIACALNGIRYSFTVFFKSLEAEFEMPRTATSSIFSVYMILFAVFAFVIGWALDRYGPRLLISLMGLFTGLSLLITSQTTAFWQIFLSYSLLLAMGTGGLIPVLMAVTSRWFDKYRGLALGITTIGLGLGPLVMAPFAAFLISNLDWRMSYMVMGLVAIVVVIPLAMLLRKDPSEIGALPDGAKSDTEVVKLTVDSEKSELPGLSLSQALKKRSFWFLWMTWLLWASSLNLILTHLVPYATDVGIPTIEASTILSVMGILFIPSSLLAGKISDNVGRRKPGVVVALLGTIALIWLIWSDSLWMFYLFAVVFGMNWGGFGVITLILPSDIFGGRSLGAIFGVLEAGFALGSALGSLMGGFIFDVTGSYVTAFAIGSGFLLITTFLITLIKPEVS